jgi:hypothetical protein
VRRSVSVSLNCPQETETDYRKIADEYEIVVRPQTIVRASFNTTRCQAHFGKLDMALDAAAVNRWTVVDMKNDWKRIFAFD